MGGKAPSAIFFGEVPEYSNGEEPRHLYFRNSL